MGQQLRILVFVNAQQMQRQPVGEHMFTPARRAGQQQRVRQLAGRQLRSQRDCRLLMPGQQHHDNASAIKWSSSSCKRACTSSSGPDASMTLMREWRAARSR